MGINEEKLSNNLNRIISCWISCEFNVNFYSIKLKFSRINSSSVECKMRKISASFVVVRELFFCAFQVNCSHELVDFLLLIFYTFSQSVFNLPSTSKEVSKDSTRLGAVKRNLKTFTAKISVNLKVKSNASSCWIKIESFGWRSLTTN
jgi:hypothetical protein